MVRRKQARPTRPGGAADLSNDENVDEILEGEDEGELAVAAGGAGTSNGLEARAGEVGGGIQDSEETRELAEEGLDGSDSHTVIKESKVEVVVPELSGDDVEFAEIALLHAAPEANDQYKGKGKEIKENGFEKASLRIRLQVPIEKKHRIGGYQELSAEDVAVELVEYGEEESAQTILSGKIDGPDSAVSAFVYLIRQAWIVMEARPYRDGVFVSKLGVFLTKRTFEYCEDNLDANKRTTPARALQSIFAWLRQEVSAEAISIHGRNGSENPYMDAIDTYGDEESSEETQSHQDSHGDFDPSALYNAILPSRNEQGLDMVFPELIPVLRPYQRRAAFWMVQRELGPEARQKDGSDDGGGASTSGRESMRDLEHPLWVPVHSLDGLSKFFYNPYSGYVSKEPHNFQVYVRGGILADEMGLGKTVEVLACILAHRASKETTLKVMEKVNHVRERLKKYKCDRVECICGATQEDDFYQGSWVQCDHCDAWQHALCVGYATPKDPDANLRRIAAQAKQVKRDEKVRLGKRVRDVHAMPVTIKTSDKSGKRGKIVYGVKVARGTEGSSAVKDNQETFVCGTCAEVIGRVEIEGDCGATLVVCPTPILRQWQDEISRHVRGGTLRVMVYDGVQKGATIMSGEGSSGNDKTERIKVVGAHELAASDLVLTTYDTLRADIHHVASQTHRIERSFRQPKRFPVVPTPLTRLKWWRVCLDEAQMVESITARAAEMALALRASHRWCVTGTPIQRGLDDLYGLVRFLGAEPFNDHFWWTIVLKQPYEEGKRGAVAALHEFFRRLMWRSTKAQVADELGIPPQEERLEWLQFAPIEAHFYRQQHERCAVKAREVISNYRKIVSLSRSPPGTRPKAQKGLDPRAGGGISSAIPEPSGVAVVPGDGTHPLLFQNGDPEVKGLDEIDDRPLTRTEAEKLLDHLRCLRQACVHPQVGSAGIRSLQRSPMTMDEILEVLVDKAILEAEDAQRSLIGALNGLAALAIIEKDTVLAVSIYREALACTEENANLIRVDPLQKLHTLHNLAEVLGFKLGTEGAGDEEQKTNLSHGKPGVSQDRKESGRPDVPRTLRDDLLLKQCKEIKEQYLATFQSKLAEVQSDLQNSTKQVQEADTELSSAGCTWWMEVLSALEQEPDRGKVLTRKLRDQLLESDHLGEAGNMGRVKHWNTSSIALRFQDVSGLKLVLVRELGALEDGRKELLQRLSDLAARMENPDLFDVERAGNCSRCQPDMKGPPCAHCEAEEVFQAYENRLFFLKVTSAGEKVVSAEDALIAQHASLALKRREGDSTGVRNKEAFTEVLERGARNRVQSSAQVTRAPSETERILTSLRGQVNIVLGRDRLPEARRHLQTLETMRKEYAQARVVALAQREVLYAMHELNMGTSRLRLRYPGEQMHNDISDLSALHEEEVPERNVQLTGEKFAALEELMQAKGQLRYLNGLKSARRNAGSGTESKDSEASVEKAEEECPVCHERTGSQFMVLPCGHVLCCKCMMLLVERSTMPQSIKKVNCPTCRRRTNVGEIAYVDNAYEKHELDNSLSQFNGGQKQDDENFVSVKGSYGTKLEAVLRRLLWLKSKDPEVKVLVFSEWQGVLDVVEHALLANHITYSRVKGGRKLNVAIDMFKGIETKSDSALQGQKRGRPENAKNVQDLVQVLLMPVRLGANGLNLVEAQHVILLEPLLNPGAEAQAINRVHRIGQTHATFVHRFIVHETVEESIYGLRRKKTGNLPKPGSNKADVCSLTLRDLSSLFTTQIGGSNNLVQEKASRVMCKMTPAAAAGAAAETRFLNSLKGT